MQFSDFWPYPLAARPHGSATPLQTHPAVTTDVLPPLPWQPLGRPSARPLPVRAVPPQCGGLRPVPQSGRMSRTRPRRRGSLTPRAQRAQRPEALAPATPTWLFLLRGLRVLRGEYPVPGRLPSAPGAGHRVRAGARIAKKNGVSPDFSRKDFRRGIIL